MTNATERHAVLLDHGWATRADGLMRPPADWPDQRARTAAAAWAEHVEQPGAAVDWTDGGDVA